MLHHPAPLERAWSPQMASDSPTQFTQTCLPGLGHIGSHASVETSESKYLSSMYLIPFRNVTQNDWDDAMDSVGLKVESL
jgi:hypothetical protein